ncbi:hypothetical protein CC1G_14914 [Coprinopsis cinerea okayama7|uniref:Uncharacterized protein n=1 Tax=Coprinopsis cinerea (strain Okayama-7 / 130 / ATCC MYA-4618 / FGSC 9003) TaxID=240176 RepID=D6RNS6_COPC7|nr:hypothetical protein CC1G_14914 [Coprinopsis cinerea okayama7\|eukprot:XP_002910936.1 hypothetical protein CC1G_14914 [Coprinopsis cinerea okayama7\
MASASRDGWDWLVLKGLAGGSSRALTGIWKGRNVARPSVNSQVSILVNELLTVENPQQASPRREDKGEAREDWGWARWSEIGRIVKGGWSKRWLKDKMGLRLDWVPKRGAVDRLIRVPPTPTVSFFILSSSPSTFTSVLCDHYNA